MHTSGARGPPLLCLGRKGRDPRRGPVNGSIVSEPSVALGVPGPPGPPPLSSSCRPVWGSRANLFPWVGKADVVCFWGRSVPPDTVGAVGKGAVAKGCWRG